MNACDTNLENVGILEEKIRQFELTKKKGKLPKNDEPRKKHPKLEPTKKKGIGYNYHTVNPHVVNNNMGWKAPKFLKSMTLFDVLEVVHSSSTQPKETKKQEESTSEAKTAIPISRSYLCDYMVVWEHGEMVVKYVGAYKKKQLMKRSVWVPKALRTNPQGPKSFWVPKHKA